MKGSVNYAAILFAILGLFILFGLIFIGIRNLPHPDQKIIHKENFPYEATEIEEVGICWYEFEYKGHRYLLAAQPGLNGIVKLEPEQKPYLNRP